MRFKVVVLMCFYFVCLLKGDFIMKQFCIPDMHTASEFFVDDRVFLQSILNEFCHVIFQLRIVVIFKAFFFFC